MKKLLGILGVGVVALIAFFNTNLKSANVTNMVAFNIANADNAEESKISGCRYTGNVDDSCVQWFDVLPGCVNNSKGEDCSR